LVQALLEGGALVVMFGQIFELEEELDGFIDFSPLRGSK
jgi:hypothetical protein